MTKWVRYICRGWCLTKAVKIKANYTNEDEQHKYCRECKALWDAKERYCICCKRRLSLKSKSLLKAKKYIE